MSPSRTKACSRLKGLFGKLPDTFAGVHPRADGIVLSLVLDAPLKNARVHKSEQVSANRHHVELKLEDPAEVNYELVAWIKQAYSLTT